MSAHLPMRVFAMRILAWTLSLLGVVVGGVAALDALHHIGIGHGAYASRLIHETGGGPAHTWVGQSAYFVDTLTHSLAAQVGVIWFDVIVFGAALPLFITVYGALWCTRLNVPDWILWIGATASSAFISIWTVLLGLKGIYWTCVDALIVVSNACAVPYYDLNGALFVLFPLAVLVVATGHAILVVARQIVQ